MSMFNSQDYRTMKALYWDARYVSATIEQLEAHVTKLAEMLQRAESEAETAAANRPSYAPAKVPTRWERESKSAVVVAKGQLSFCEMVLALKRQGKGL